MQTGGGEEAYGVITPHPPPFLNKMHGYVTGPLLQITILLAFQYDLSLASLFWLFCGTGSGDQL